MKRDIKKEFKDIVRVAAPVEKVWMSGYLEANIDEDLDPVSITSPLKPKDNTDSIPREKNSSNGNYLSMVGSLANTDVVSKEASQNGNNNSNSTIVVLEPPPQNIESY